jgi:hypothetical protein
MTMCRGRLPRILTIWQLTPRNVFGVSIIKGFWVH